MNTMDFNHQYDILQEGYNIYDGETILSEILDRPGHNIKYGSYNSDILLIFRDEVQYMINTEFKNSTNYWYYPNDIIILVDQYDPEYNNYIIGRQTLYNEKNDLKYYRFVGGKVTFSLIHGSDNLFIFIRPTLVLAISQYTSQDISRDGYNYNSNDITKEMYLDYFRATIKHEIYHYKQYQYLITKYRSDTNFIKFVYSYENNLLYENRFLEKEVKKINHNELLKYSIYLPNEYKVLYDIEPFDTFFIYYLNIYNNRESTQILSKNFYIMIYNIVKNKLINEKSSINDIVVYLNRLLVSDMKMKAMIKK